MTVDQFIAHTTDLLKQNKPFFFLIDFDLEMPFVCPMDKAAELGIFFEVEGLKNHDFLPVEVNDFVFDPHPIDYQTYRRGFDIVMDNIINGNTYLLNLTFPTHVDTNLTLAQIFRNVKAKYKLLVRDGFVLFSPEAFIRIKGNRIYTYPMKGTIDASLPDAEKIILSDRKELFEHYTVVDLLRNDLAMIATHIEVNRFRYTNLVHTHKGEIIQVSSEIEGILPDNWRDTFAEKLVQMLPAGSVSGAPKKKTVEIIHQAEIDQRGYYTGIFGLHLAGQVISAVNIRYIEKKNGNFIFRSGGGITAFSKPENEYNELIQKVYIPLSVR